MGLDGLIDFLFGGLRNLLYDDAGEFRPLTLVSAFIALAAVCAICGLMFNLILNETPTPNNSIANAGDSADPFESMLESGPDEEPAVESNASSDTTPNEENADSPSEPPPDGDYILTYTDGQMVCPGVGEFPAALLEPHPITITHEEEDGSLYALTPEGALHFFPGVLPAVPVDGVEGDGVINSSGISVESADVLEPHPSKYTATFDAEGMTLTYEMDYRGGNQITGTTSSILDYEELDTTCYITMDVRLDYSGQ